MINIINRIKPKGQVGILGWVCLWLLSFLIVNFAFLTHPAYAIVDPLASPNNKFGIHIISATPDELIPAQALVNSSGGAWG